MKTIRKRLPTHAYTGEYAMVIWRICAHPIICHSITLGLFCIRSNHRAHIIDELHPKKNSQPPYPSPHFPSTSTSTKYLFVTLVFMMFFFTLTLYHSFPLTAHCLFNAVSALSSYIYNYSKKYWFIFSHAHVHAHTALSGSLSGRTGIGLYFNLSTVLTAVLARQVQIPTDVNNKLTFLCANFSLWHTLNCVFISSTAL